MRLFSSFAKWLGLTLGLLLMAVIFFRYSPWGTSLLWDVSQHGSWLLPLVTVAALLDSINPCAFSILLLSIAFLFSIGQLRDKILIIGGAYIFGLFVVYLAIGLGLLGTLHLFGTPHFMAKLGAILMLVFGAINLLGALFPRWPIRFAIPKTAHPIMARLMEQGSLPAAIALGMLVGICEFPCTGGPYLMVLGLLRDSHTYARGVGYLVYYNLIFVLPLVLTLFIAGDQTFASRLRNLQTQHGRQLHLWVGGAMLAFGLLILAL